ncbi:trigger factor [bacterium]|nr:MAG: trigger factor [bacterium]
MQIINKKLPQSEIELEISVPHEEMKSFLIETAKKISQSKEIKGFRLGKAPMSAVEKAVGPMKILEESLTKIVDAKLKEAAVKEGIDIIGFPNITVSQMVPGNDLKFKAQCMVLPEIKLGSYKDLKINGKDPQIEKVEVSKEEVGKALEFLQKSRAVVKEIDRETSLEKKDLVEISFVGRIGGVKFEGGESKNHPLVMGESNLIPGFEENLEGMKKGDEKTFEISFPSDYHKKEFAGKKASFDVKMEIVKERVLAELNDEFAKSIGKFESIDKLTESVKDGLSKEKQEKEKEKMHLQLLKEIVKTTEVEIPELLIKNELKRMKQELEGDVAKMGMKLEDYLLQIGKTISSMEEAWHPKAEERVKSSIVLMKIAEQEKISVSKEEIDVAMSNMIYSMGLSKEELGKVDIDQMRGNMRSRIMNVKVLELIESLNIK